MDSDSDRLEREVAFGEHPDGVGPPGPVLPSALGALGQFLEVHGPEPPTLLGSALRTELDVLARAPTLLAQFHEQLQGLGDDLTVGMAITLPAASGCPCCGHALGAP